MELAEVLVGALGALLLAGSIAGAVRPSIHPREQRVFRAMNRMPSWLFWPLWVPMQLGNLVVGTLAGLAVAWWREDRGLAVAVVLAVALKLVTERGLRQWLAPRLTARQRPGTSQPGAVLRGRDVPRTGPSFPSGHVILVAAVGAVVAVDLPAELVALPFALAGLVALGRVYVGAHNPLDVTAGLGLGLLMGASLAIPLT